MYACGVYTVLQFVSQSDQLSAAAFALSAEDCVALS